VRGKLLFTADAIRDIADKYFPTGEEGKFTLVPPIKLKDDDDGDSS
jgi:hypothetical protein